MEIEKQIKKLEKQITDLQRQNDEAALSYEGVAKFLGLSVRQVKRIAPQLEANGALKRTWVGKQSPRFSRATLIKKFKSATERGVSLV